MTPVQDSIGSTECLPLHIWQHSHKILFNVPDFTFFQTQYTNTHTHTQTRPIIIEQEIKSRLRFSMNGDVTKANRLVATGAAEFFDNKL